MSRTRYTYGSASLDVDTGGLEELLRRAVEDVAPAVAERMGQTARELHDDAKSKWPVGPEKVKRKGRHSRDELGWEVVVDVRTGTIRARVFCTAEWARYIKPKGLRGKTAFIEYLRKPLAKARDPLVNDVRRIIVDIMEGR